jgi:hypothetical protein
LIVVAFLIAHVGEYSMAREELEERFTKWVTVLEREPEYLLAIGTVAVEIGNLEVMLGGLFAAITTLPPDTADAIYWAPLATGPRLSILNAAIDTALNNSKTYLRRAKKLATDAQKLANRRNDVIHHTWGLGQSGKVFEVRRMPSTKYTAKPVPINQVKDLVYEIRILVEKVIDLTDELWADPSYTPSIGTRPPPDRPPVPDNHQPYGDAKPPRQRRSSRK